MRPFTGVMLSVFLVFFLVVQGFSDPDRSSEKEQAVVSKGAVPDPVNEGFSGSGTPSGVESSKKSDSIEEAVQDTEENELIEKVKKKYKKPSQKDKRLRVKKQKIRKKVILTEQY